MCQLHLGAAELLSAALNSVQKKVRPLEVEDLDKVSQGYHVQSDVRRKTQLHENICTVFTAALLRKAEN